MKLCECGCGKIANKRFVRGHSNMLRLGKSIDDIYGKEKADILRKKLRFKKQKKKHYTAEQLEKLKLNREKNKERIYQYNHDWRIKNKEHSKLYRQLKRQNNIDFKLLEYLRARMGNALRRCKGIKESKTIKLIGCSIKELKEHLRNQFKEGMYWKNYGEWHIDHIIPCANFDLKKLEEQKKCFHYTNLQPLWAKDNFKKGAKIL